MEKEKKLSNFRVIGLITDIDYERGFGFISVEEDGEDDYFFHANSVKDENPESDKEPFELLNTGDRVSFKPFKGKKGWKALGVEKV